MIRSLDQQLRDARDATDSGFVCAHIDTCLPDFLGDHHNRDNELLLGVPIHCESSIAEVKESLLSEFSCIAWDMAGEKPNFDLDKARASIEDAFSEAPMSHRFDPTLQHLDEEDEEFGETCQAWFLISWNLPDDDS